MTNTQNVTIVLLAVAAVILGVLIFVQTDRVAYAESPDRSGNYTVINGAISSSTDMVFVLNGQTDTLIAYLARRNDSQLVMVKALDLKREFSRER